MKRLIKNLLCLCALITMMTACHKDDTVPAEYFFRGQLAGAPLAFEISTNSEAQMATSNGASLNAPNCTFSYDCGIGTNFAEPTEKSISITFPSMFSGKCSDQSTSFPLLFVKKTYRYGEVIVTYFDGTDSWTSVSTLQRGGTFEITQSEAVKVGFSTTQKVSGKLSCLLFNARGVEKKLESASFTLSFEPWQL
jgi:hypothetical protein